MDSGSTISGSTKKEDCDPNEVALKTFFLGPQAENREWLRSTVVEMFEQWFHWRESYFPEDGRAVTEANQHTKEFCERQKHMRSILRKLVIRFEDEVPKFTPRYVGHMFSEQSLPALLGHILTLLHNPNNVSGEASKIGLQIEREAISDLGLMLGWKSAKQGMGHFTSGGTLANFEALCRAKSKVMKRIALGVFVRSLSEKGPNDLLVQVHELANKLGFPNLKTMDLFSWAHLASKHYEPLIEFLKTVKVYFHFQKEFFRNSIVQAKQISETFHVSFEGPLVLVPYSKHYSWPKSVELLGLGSDRMLPIELDACGRLDIKDLKLKIEKCKNNQTPIAAVVSIGGTTELGTVDPIADIQSLLQDFKEQGLEIWHHLDAAYGGFLCSMQDSPDFNDFQYLRKQLKAFQTADSVTLDPHKLGYVPYASGVILIRDRKDYFYQNIEAPYLQFEGHDDAGLQTIEGSRSAAGAVATWLTERSIGLNSQGYGSILHRTLLVKNHVQELFKVENINFFIPEGLDTNVLAFTLAEKGQKLSVLNEKANAVYQQMSPTNWSSFIISKTSLNLNSYRKVCEKLIQDFNVDADVDDLVLLRVCLMNPFFESKESQVNYAQELVKSISCQFSALSELKSL